MGVSRDSPRSGGHKATISKTMQVGNAVVRKEKNRLLVEKETGSTGAIVRAQASRAEKGSPGPHRPAGHSRMMGDLGEAQGQACVPLPALPHLRPGSWDSEALTQ